MNARSLRIGGVALAVLLTTFLTGCVGTWGNRSALQDIQDQVYNVADLEELMKLIYPYLRRESDDALVFDVSSAKAVDLPLEVVRFGTKLEQQVAISRRAGPRSMYQPQAYPSYPASIYITDVTPWRNGNGVSIILTWDGFVIGKIWNGAQALAYFTISEYERLIGRKKWPYTKRSQRSVAFEILVHCLVIYTPAWRRSFPIDIGFDEWWWD